MMKPYCGSSLKPLAVIWAAHFLDVGIFSTSNLYISLLRKTDSITSKSDLSSDWWTRRDQGEEASGVV